MAPNDDFVLTTLGIVHYRQSRFDDALKELRRAIEINPDSATAHNYLGITASQKGRQAGKAPRRGRAESAGGAAERDQKGGAPAEVRGRRFHAQRPGDDRTQAEKRGQVENVRAQYHAHAKLTMPRGERHDRGGDFRRICSQRSHETEKTFR